MSGLIPPPGYPVCDLCPRADRTVKFCSKCSHWLCEDCRNDYPARLAAFAREKILGRKLPQKQPPPNPLRENQIRDRTSPPCNGCAAAKEYNRRRVLERLHRRI